MDYRAAIIKLVERIQSESNLKRIYKFVHSLFLHE